MKLYLLICLYLPLDINATITVKDTASFKEYARISEYCKDSVDNLFRQVDTLSADFLTNKVAVPFIFLSGSSGMGKSQLAISCFQRASRDRHVWYFLFSDGETTQEIYESFSSISSLFKSCRKKDMKSLLGSVKGNVEKGNNGIWKFLKEKPCYIYGFISELLSLDMEKFAQEDHTVVVSPKTLLELSTELAEYRKKMKTPVFIIDEIPCIHRHKVTKKSIAVRMSRNAFRLAGIVPVLTGTNSTAINLLPTSKDSFGSRNWVCLIAARHKLSLKSLGWNQESEESMPKVWKEVLLNSRPRFACWATKYLEDLLDKLEGTADERFKKLHFVRTLDGLCKHIFEKSAAGKRITDTEGGKCGQMCLLQAHYSYESLNSKKKGSNIVQYHYANLEHDNNCILTRCSINRDLKYIDGSNKSKTFNLTKCKFPPPENDVLLHLSHLGGLNIYPFQNGGTVPVTFRSFVDARLSSLTHCTYIRMDGNSISDNGLRMESLVAGSVCIASRQKGVRGSLFKDFFGNLFVALGLTYCDNPEMSDNAKNIISSQILNFKVPFLPSPNVKWPCYLIENKDLLFGKFQRTTNSSQIDFQASSKISAAHLFPCELSGECKDYSKPITITDFCAAIKRIPHESCVHIFVCNQLAKFSKSPLDCKTKDNERAVKTVEDLKNIYSSSHFYKVVHNNNPSVTVDLVKVPFLPPHEDCPQNDSPQRIVFIFCLEENIN